MKVPEGHMYETKKGKRFFVAEGSFLAWNKYIEKHPELQNGSFQCRRGEKKSDLTYEKIEKGIYKVLE